MEVKKDGSSILITIGWLSVGLLIFNLIPPFLMLFPICIGVVIRRDYQEYKQQGLAMIILGVISGIIGLFLAIYLYSRYQL